MFKEYLKERKNEFDFDDIEYNTRFIKLYNKILFNPTPRVKGFIGENIYVLDVGSGGGGFVRVCQASKLNAEGIDYQIDFEKDKLQHEGNLFDFVHFNAVIEHLENPENILKEIHRVLEPGGILIINTPNWKLDYKNFYNDPTHEHPYTPESLSMLVKMFGFRIILCEPALIRRSTLWWKVPFKWKIASLLPKGSKSILLMAQKE